MSYFCKICSLEYIPSVTDHMFKIELKKITCLYCNDQENKKYYDERIDALNIAREQLKEYKTINDYRTSCNPRHHTIKIRKKLITPDFVKDFTCTRCHRQTEMNHKICRFCYGQVKYKCLICNSLYFKSGKISHQKTRKHKNNEKLLNESWCVYCMLKPRQVGNKCIDCDIKVKKNHKKCMNDSTEIILDI